MLKVVVKFLLVHGMLSLSHSHTHRHRETGTQTHARTHHTHTRTDGTYAHIHTRTHTCTYTYTHTYTHARAHRHTYTQTHTTEPPSSGVKKLLWHVGPTSKLARVKYTVTSACAESIFGIISGTYKLILTFNNSQKRQRSSQCFSRHSQPRALITMMM